MQGFELSLETAKTDQHSGVVGGAARNPIGELMKLVSEMYDATTGKVKIKGFYDDVVLPSKAEVAEFRRSGFSGSRDEGGSRSGSCPPRWNAPASYFGCSANGSKPIS